MKNSRLIAVVLVCFLSFSCSEKKQQFATIQVFLSEEIPEQIVYTATIDGTTFWDFADRVSPDSTGKFSINIPLQSPGFIRIYRNKDMVLIIKPNQKYNIEISKDTAIITSPHQQLQDYYNTLLNTIPRACDFPYDNEDLLLAYNNLDSMFDAEEQKFNHLFAQKHFSEELLQLAITDRSVFYQTAKATLASKRISAHTNQFNKVPLDTLALYGKAVMSIDLNSPHLLAANYAYDFLYSFFWYKVYSTVNLDEFREIRAQMYKDGKAQCHELELAKEIFEDSKLKEFYLASHLYFLGFRYKEEAKPEYLQFKSDYPLSPYLKYLEKRYETNFDS